MASIDRSRAARALVLIAAFLGLAACSVMGHHESPLPKDGPNLIEVYRDHIANEGVGGKSPRELLPLRGADDDNAPSLRRTDLSPLQQRFQRLPNPDLVMHVFPHLARGRYPVPGYVTVFPMYETVEYAMPGEVFERPVRPAGAAATTAAAPTPPAGGVPTKAAMAPPLVRVAPCRGEGGCSAN